MTKYLFIVCVAVTVLRSHAQTCGSAEPDPEKTCITIRLPWEENPMFFCTDKANFKYKQQCHDPTTVTCGDHSSTGTLLVATPWECCPTESLPDPCIRSRCAPAPFNRTCTPKPSTSGNAWDCCPKFFCENAAANVKKPEECALARLRPGCTSPPKGKTNCVAFNDEHGCCNHYQCEGEGKPGLCPMQKLAMKYSVNATSGAGVPSLPPPAPVAELHSDKRLAAGFAPGLGYGLPQCVGDFNCPGNLKCCSSDVSVYSDGTAIPKNTYATSGQCTEPEKEA